MPTPVATVFAQRSPRSHLFYYCVMSCEENLTLYQQLLLKWEGLGTEACKNGQWPQLARVGPAARVTP